MAVDSIARALATKALQGDNDKSGVLVGAVDQNSTMPTARPDGSALENEDYVKAKTSATFPFTINGITFQNKFTKAIYFNHEWIVDVGLIQDTAETPLANQNTEKFETARNNQAQLNIDIIDQLKNAIIEYADLDTVPTAKLYKRIYRQTADTTARTAGLYWRNFATNEWEKLGGSDIESGNLLHSGKYEGELFILLADVAGNPKTKKGLYRYNGSLWVHIAHTEPYSTEIEAKDKTVESISKTATTQEAINKENALIIGQEKDIDVDEEVDLIGAVNWLNDNKVTQKRFRIGEDNRVIDDEGETLSITDISQYIGEPNYLPYFEVDGNKFFYGGTKDGVLRWFGAYVAEEEVGTGSVAQINYGAVVEVRTNNKAYFTKSQDEMVVYKISDLKNWTTDKAQWTHPERVYPTAQAVVDQLVKETEFKLDETGTKDKLSLKVTNNNGDDIIDEEIEIDKVLIRVNTLPDVNVNVSRFYLLTEDTAAYDAGIYYATMDDDEVVWTKVSGNDEQGGILVATVKQGDTMPTKRPDGTDLQNEDYVKPQPTATFPFTINGVTFDNKFTKAIYFNNTWIIDAGLIQDTSETPVVDKTVESYDGTATTQKAINTQVANIIGKDKEIDVDEEVDLIGSVNWLNDNKLTQMKLKLESNGDIKDEEGNVLTLAKIIELFNSKKYWMFLDCENIVFLPTTPTSSNEFKFLGDFSLPEEIADDEYINVESFAEVVVKDDNKGYYSQFDNETTSFKMEDIDVYIDIKNSLKHPEKFYPTVQAVIDYVDEHTAKLYKIENSIEYGGAMIPKFVKDDIIAIANYLAKGINVTIKDKYNAYYSVIRADHLNDGEYEIEHEYYDGKSIVWTYMTDGDAITYKMVEPILVDKEYDALETVNKTVIGAINELNSIETYQFKGYVSKTEPTGTLKEGELWYLGEEMPTTFPINVKEYKNGAWSALVVQYTPVSLDLWADLENKHGYYWFGNDWNLIDIDIEVDGETIDFNDAGQIKVADEAIKNQHINPELKAKTIEEDDDDQLATEGAVYGELIKETTLELDETGAKDKLSLKVTNNNDQDIIDKEIEIDKPIIAVDALPTEGVKTSRLYRLTQDTDAYEAGLYTATKNADDTFEWARLDEGDILDNDKSTFELDETEIKDKLSLIIKNPKDEELLNKEIMIDKPIIRVDTLPTSDVNISRLYLLEEDTDDYDSGVYYPTKVGDDIVWTKVGKDDIIVSVDELPTENIDENTFYYLTTDEKLYYYKDNEWHTVGSEIRQGEIFPTDVEDKTLFILEKYISDETPKGLYIYRSEGNKWELLASKNKGIKHGTVFPEAYQDSELFVLEENIGEQYSKGLYLYKSSIEDGKASGTIVFNENIDDALDDLPFGLYQVKYTLFNPSTSIILHVEEVEKKVVDGQIVLVIHANEYYNPLFYIRGGTWEYDYVRTMNFGEGETISETFATFLKSASYNPSNWEQIADLSSDIKEVNKIDIGNESYEYDDKSFPKILKTDFEKIVTEEHNDKNIVLIWGNKSEEIAGSNYKELKLSYVEIKNSVQNGHFSFIFDDTYMCVYEYSDSEYIIPQVYNLKGGGEEGGASIKYVPSLPTPAKAEEGILYVHTEFLDASDEQLTTTGFSVAETTNYYAFNDGYSLVSQPNSVCFTIQSPTGAQWTIPMGLFNKGLINKICGTALISSPTKVEDCVTEYQVYYNGTAWGDPVIGYFDDWSSISTSYGCVDVAKPNEWYYWEKDPENNKVTYNLTSVMDMNNLSNDHSNMLAILFRDHRITASSVQTENSIFRYYPKKLPMNATGYVRPALQTFAWGDYKGSYVWKASLYKYIKVADAFGSTISGVDNETIYCNTDYKLAVMDGGITKQKLDSSMGVVYENDVQTLTNKTIVHGENGNQILGLTFDADVSWVPTYYDTYYNKIMTRVADELDIKPTDRATHNKVLTPMVVPRILELARPSYVVIDKITDIVNPSSNRITIQKAKFSVYDERIVNFSCTFQFTTTKTVYNTTKNAEKFGIMTFVSGTQVGSKTLINWLPELNNYVVVPLAIRSDSAAKPTTTTKQTGGYGGVDIELGNASTGISVVVPFGNNTASGSIETIDRVFRPSSSDTFTFNATWFV
ncbi:MAG: hypothetical protein KBT27_06400 [Prevotellaceae bacterium]|nr:hypothetical protein [Candidatus Faecinaster equi]